MYSVTRVEKKNQIVENGDGEIKDPATLKQGRCRVGIEVLQGGLLLEDGRVLWEEQAEAGGGA